MAMTFFKEVKVSTGEYTNSQGETKKSYTKIGAMFKDEQTGSMSIKLDVLPMGKEGGVWLSLFDKYEENKQTQPAQQFGSQPPQQPQPQAQVTQPIPAMYAPPQQPITQPQQVNGETPF